MNGMRVFRLLTALLQLSLPASAAWADTRLDVAGAHATAHVEARIHPPDCALCHFLSAPFTGHHAAALRLATSDARAARPIQPVPPRGAVPGFFPPPRAPPALS